MFLTTYEPRSVLDHADLVNRWFAPARQSSKAAAWVPAVDISEYEDRFVLVADVPGVAPDSIDIAVDRDILTISGERVVSLAGETTAAAKVEDASAANGDVAGDVAPEAAGPQAHRRERASGKFSRQFRLPETVDVDAVNARGEHGVLVVNLPKATAGQPRKIAVQS